MKKLDHSPDQPLLSGLVIHWRNEDHVQTLARVWPDDRRFELLVIDNSASAPPLPDYVRTLDPGRNLGFAGGVNLGLKASSAPWVLVLNPDACPEEDALQQLVQGFADYPNASGLVPALLNADGSSQHGWQLRSLPSPGALLLQTLLISTPEKARQEPDPGTPIEQPAAAALALKRQDLVAVGGMDEGFQPAWFEDVDLAYRLAAAGMKLLYFPASRFVHAQGSTVPLLGYGPFLWIYYRNLRRYLHLHHGAPWAIAARPLLAIGMLLRLLLLPLRRPRRARSRAEAARGLLATLAAALSDWRWPASYRRRFPASHSVPAEPS